jgi:hypothetical protein
MVSLNLCALMREPLEHPEPFTVKQADRAERRRRSLRKGIGRWHQDVMTHGRDRGEVLLIGLSVADSDPMSARGEIRRFWSDFRVEFGLTPYFSWAELQKRGATHYHAIIVNPPWRRVREWRHWLQEHWPLAAVQPSIEKRDMAWFRARGGQYVRKYASEKWTPHQANRDPRVNGAAERPLADKSYQQEYEALPREIRTWECNRLAHRVAELDEHRDKIELVCTAPWAPLHVRLTSFWILARIRHVIPPRGCCTLAQIKTRTPQSTRSPRQVGGSGGAITRAPCVA